MLFVKNHLSPSTIWCDVTTRYLLSVLLSVPRKTGRNDAVSVLKLKLRYLRFRLLRFYAML